MRLLFVKTRLEWPRTTGHDVHCYEMMRALASLGHEIVLLTEAAPVPQAVAGLRIAGVRCLDEAVGDHPVTLSYLQERFRRYWGIDAGLLRRVAAIVAGYRPDAVVVVGADTLPYLAGVGTSVRVWYAADEWVRHHLSVMASAPGGAWTHFRAAVVKGVYERAYAPLVDRIWVVSEGEQRAMRLVTGLDDVDVVPNGVDCDAFSPLDGEITADSAVFWGRLSFAPNARAIRWFCARVWPRLRGTVPGATLAILGSDPPDHVARLAGRDGITLLANLPDLRQQIASRSVVVMPFVSGGGIKNKLLEAAAMAKPIVATPKALRGLRSDPPVVVARSAGDFAEAVGALWSDPTRQRHLGAEARRWVSATHTWKAAAEEALLGLEASLRRAAGGARR